MAFLSLYALADLLERRQRSSSLVFILVCPKWRDHESERAGGERGRRAYSLLEMMMMMINGYLYFLREPFLDLSTLWCETVRCDVTYMVVVSELVDMCKMLREYRTLQLCPDQSYSVITHGYSSLKRGEENVGTV